MEKIIIKGARVHNLKNIDVEIPKNKLVVFSGISGSGKSSLAFDTIYAEGQRRYVESLASYARQFLGVMDKPDVDYIDGLSPAISIDQKSTSHNPRSTVGTITEIYDYLRLLFARIGHPHCPICGREISHQSKDQITDEIQKLGQKAGKRGLRALILAPIVKDRKGEFRELFADLKKKGYQTARIDGKVISISDDFVLIKTNKHTIDAIIDRLVLPATDKQRLSESVETALKLGEGSAVVAEILDKTFEIPQFPTKFTNHLFSEKFACPVDNISLPEIEPRSFSFNSPHGACPECTGLGSIPEIDPDLVFSPNLSIAEGGVLPWARVSTHETWFSRLIEQVAKELGFSVLLPLGELSAKAKQILLYGAFERVFTVTGPNRYGRIVSWDMPFEGIIPNLMRRYKETNSDYIRKEIEKFMRMRLCPACNGSRLKKESMSVTIDAKSIADISEMSIVKCKQWVQNLNKINHSQREEIISRPILKELSTRLGFLVDVGLDYLTVSRRAQTLAGGEAQRIRLASQIGSGLSGVLYVLDEPSIGLHQRDNHRLLETLKKLRDLGNSVIVVEHDRDTIENADHIIDFGPGAGENGGKIIAMGTLQEIIKNPNSLTGKYMSGKKTIKVHSSQLTVNSLEKSTNREPLTNNQLTVLGAKEHNLKDINVTFPLGKFICVTGVSGSGKSTLVNDVLYNALAALFYRSKEIQGAHKGISGSESIDKVILIDQSPIGRS
ncbi:excinuclease ABC subunit A, partial [Candidatus Curtissbacteria bacterium RBG_13_40_7]